LIKWFTKTCPPFAGTKNRDRSDRFITRLDILAPSPNLPEFRNQIDLDLLYFDQPLPLVGQQMVDLVVQVPDFELGF
jgi:hypothetical protein